MRCVKKLYSMSSMAFHTIPEKALKAYALAALTGVFLMGSQAFANDIGQMANSAVTEVRSVGQFIVDLSYMLAFGVGMMGAWKLYQASKTQGQTTYKEAMTMLMVAGLLAVITTVVGAASGTVFSNGTQQGAPSVQQPSFG